MASAASRQRFNKKILGLGYGAMALVLVGIGVWLKLAGPPAKPVLASVTVQVETQQTIPNAGSDSLPALAKAPIGMAAAMPFTADARPRIAIVVAGLGPSVALAESAIRHLPPETTLAFLTSSSDLSDLANEARAAGHETLLDVPMEPATYPEDDPGPGALVTTANDNDNLRRLDTALGKAQGYVGIINFMGSRFTAAQEKLPPVLSMLHDRNMMIVDTRANALTLVPALAGQMKLPFAVADLTIDAEPSREAIDQALAQLEQIAKTNGKALGIAGTYPISVDRIAEWSKSLAAKGIALAPVSAVATMPK